MAEVHFRRQRQAPTKKAADRIAIRCFYQCSPVGLWFRARKTGARNPAGNLLRGAA